jgi:hypothetical protein
MYTPDRALNNRTRPDTAGWMCPVESVVVYTSQTVWILDFWVPPVLTAVTQRSPHLIFAKFAYDRYIASITVRVLSSLLMLTAENDPRYVMM